MDTLTKPTSRSGRRGQKDGTQDKAVADKAAADKAIAEKAAADAANKAAGDNDVTLKQLEDTLNKVVGEQLKAAKAPNQLTEDAIRKIIAEEIAAAALDSKKLTAEQIGKLAADASTKAFEEANRKDTKNLRNAADATKTREQIEIPFALRKGNLPLHMKQLANRLCSKPENEDVPESMLQKGKDLEDAFWTGVATRGAKALTTSGDGTGAEWLPRTLSSELYRRLYLESQIAQGFLAQEIQMPTNPYDYPLLTADPEFKLNNVENTNAVASDLTSSKFTLTAQRLMALCQFSYEADEDSIIPLLPTVQQQLARAAARALEQSILNGDTSTTHFDTGYTVAANDVRRAWKGLRKLAIAASLTVDFSTGGVSRANLLALVAAMGKWGVRSQDLMWVVGTNGWAKLLGLDEVALAYARGSASTYVTGGPTPAPWGGTIAVSEQIDETQTSAGIYDGNTVTKGQILVFNKAGFVFGSRREFTVEVDRNIKSQTHDVVASFRKAFSPVETPSSTIKTVALARNYNA